LTINFSRHRALQVCTAPAGRKVACRIERSIPAGSATATASSLRHTDDDAFVAIAGKAANASMYKRGASTVGAFGNLRRRRVNISKHRITGFTPNEIQTAFKNDNKDVFKKAFNKENKN